MAVSIKNPSGGAIALPWPYIGVVRAGKSMLVPGTMAEVVTALNDPSGALKLREVSDSELDKGPTAKRPIAARLLFLENAAAKGVATVHASRLATAADNIFPGPITQPTTPRALQAVYAATWDGGTITIVGTDQFGAAVTETIAAGDGAAVLGVRIFKTVTQISKAAVGTHAVGVTIGTIDKFAVPGPYRLADAVGALSVGGVGEVVTLDATRHAFTPTTAANGAVDYVLQANILA